MKRNTLKLIIFLTSLSLIALISLQVFWIANAFSLAEQQHDHRVAVALKDVLNDIKGLRKDLNGNEPHLHEVDNQTIDSLLRTHFTYQNLDTVYTFAIAPIGQKKKQACGCSPNCKTHHQPKQYKTCISELKTNTKFDLQVFFPNKTKNILLQMSTWLILSLVFLIVVIWSFTYIVITTIRQKKLSEMKNDFINNMTHEFKTPLATISLASEILGKSATNPTSERVGKYSKIIQQETTRLKDDVNKILEAAKLDKGNLDLLLEAINLNKLIKESVSSLCLEEGTKPVDLSYKLTATPADVWADKGHLRNVINNLVENAYKYSTSQAIIEIASYNQKEGVVFTVTDNGIGMTPEAQKRAFDKFYRQHTGDVHNVKGFGLGLFYVKTMVEAFNGKVTVKSEPRKGSTFEVLLPYPSQVG